MSLNDLTREELETGIGIEAVRMGHRIKVKQSLHERETPEACPNGVHGHWRVIVCDNETDVIECARCGKQRLTVCNFDDDFS